MKWFPILIFAGLICFEAAADNGRSIYLEGKDENGTSLKAVINDIDSGGALACVNCHRESGLGTSESGTTIPPVSWRFLGVNQPPDDTSRFYSIQNKRPAYNAELLYRLLTTGVDSRGREAKTLMPRYAITRQQTNDLVDYLKTLYPTDDPGVDGEIIRIATVVDSRLPIVEKRQHLDFIRGLFKMKNAGTRGESRRKEFAPIQKAPQYESYRKWELVVWELSGDVDDWEQQLSLYYKDKPVFIVLAPLVMSGDLNLQAFCRGQRIPCLFPLNASDSPGDYYNFVYRDTAKQRRDYLAHKLRVNKNALLFLDNDGVARNLGKADLEIPEVSSAGVSAFAKQFDELCNQEATLVIAVNSDTAKTLHKFECSTGQRLKLILLGEPSMQYRDIVGIVNHEANSNICWATNYDKVLSRNTRQVRVSILAKKFGIDQVIEENLAKDLFAFGLLSDSLHQLNGNFSRAYLIETVEHMLNSYPNFTYFTSVSGAPGQRAIVGQLREYCPGAEQS